MRWIKPRHVTGNVALTRAAEVFIEFPFLKFFFVVGVAS